MNGFCLKVTLCMEDLCSHRAIWVLTYLLIGLVAVGCGKGKILTAPKGLSVLSIYSVPQGAAISFDGSVRGRAYAQKPLVIKGVPYGWHNIKVSLPSYVSRIEQVWVDRVKTSLRIRLSKKSFGRLTVVVEPSGAEVFVDSRYYGNAAPAVNVDSLPFGEHTIFVRKKGFLSERRSIVVERQFHYSYRLRLKAEK